MTLASPIRDILTAASDGRSGPALEYRLAPHVVCAVAWDGSSRLIDVAGLCYGLPAHSTALLTITLRQGVEQAVREVAARYAVAQEDVRADLTSFLRTLVQQGLLIRSAQARRWPRLGWVGIWSFARILRLLLRTGRSDPDKARALLAGAYLSLKLLGWARTMEVWRLALAGSNQSAEADPERLESIHRAVREALAHSIFPVDCKARALCCWALVRSVGQPARLVVGIDLFPFLGHCWCESGSRILGDGGDRAGRFTPVLQYA